MPRRTLGAICGIGLLAIAMLYLWCPVHRFPAARPFHGARWYNPYAGITAATPWRKVNLHAHSRVWLGVTNGHGSADDVLQRYRALGYDAAPTSNYQEISRATSVDSSALAVYEQGYNARKVHFLAVAPRRVDWLDYPLIQGRDEEQHRIDRLRATSGLVILAHPRLRHAMSDADLRTLTGYAAMEIGSNASRGEGAWDVALDAGRAVWGVANDDSHHVGAPSETGRYWTMLAAPETDGAALEAALASGRAYAVFGKHGRADIAIRSVSLVGDTVAVTFAGAPGLITLIGPGGRVFAATRGVSARWVIPCDAGWVRIVVRTRTTQLFLEPMIRSEDGALPRVAATVASVPTLVRRTLAVALGVLGLAAWLGTLLGREAGLESLGARRLPLRSAA